MKSAKDKKVEETNKTQETSYFFKEIPDSLWDSQLHKTAAKYDKNEKASSDEQENLTGDTLLSILEVSKRAEGPK